MKLPSVLFMAALLVASAAWAQSFRMEAKDEGRVREIAALLRCPVCQSESILDSQSGTAREMVAILREQIAQGHGRSDILEFFRSRYGDYVLLQPPVQGPAAAIWLLPFALLVLGVIVYGMLLWRDRQASQQQRAALASREPLSEAWVERLEP